MPGLGQFSITNIIICVAVYSSSSGISRNSAALIVRYIACIAIWGHIQSSPVCDGMENEVLLLIIFLGCMRNNIIHCFINTCRYYWIFCSPNKNSRWAVAMVTKIEHATGRNDKMMVHPHFRHNAKIKLTENEMELSMLLQCITTLLPTIKRQLVWHLFSF